MLTVTEMLRQHKVVRKFVEFYGEGVASVPLANREAYTSSTFSFCAAQ